MACSGGMKVAGHGKRAVSVGVTTLLLALARAAPAAEPNATALARQHFERGYAAAQRGELEVAVAEFEGAYAASPNSSVLFNLGQAYASAGRAVDAVQTLERYLELGGTAIPAERRTQVEALITYHSRSLGDLALEVAPAGAEVTLDGRNVGTAPFAAPLRVPRGTHTVVVTLPGYERRLESFEARAGERAALRIELVPIAPSARLRVTCAVPDVAVALDGSVIGRTPLRAPVAALPGPRVLELERAGYVTERRTLELPPGGDAEVTCGLRPTRPTAAFARLSLTHPIGTLPSLDGQPFAGQAVPPGRHRLVVTGSGFERSERTVTLAPGAVTRLTVVPHRSGSVASRELEQRGDTQRVVSYVFGGAGLALVGTALGLFIYNNGQHAEWEEDSAAFKQAYAADPTQASLTRLDALLVEERAIRNRDALALGAGVLGGALLCTAFGLYLTAPAGEPSLTVTGRVALDGRGGAKAAGAAVLGAF